MKNYIKILLLPGLFIGVLAPAKPKSNPLAPYRPTLRELLIEDVQIERFRLEDPEEEKWLNIPTPSLGQEKSALEKAHRPVAIGSLHK